MLLGAFPGRYPSAIVLFETLQILVIVGSVCVLGIVYRYQPIPLLCVGWLLVLGSGPVYADLGVGNLGCFQLAVLSGCPCRSCGRPPETG